MTSSFQSQSVVWPADYNWQQVSEIPQGFFHYSPNSTFWYPWFLSMWTMGMIKPGGGAGGGSSPTRINVLNHPSSSSSSFSKHQQQQHQQQQSEEKDGSLKEIVGWKQIDLQYPSRSAKEYALKNKHFIPENNLPLGLQTYRNRIFVSLPKWKEGVPVTLGVFGKDEGYSPIIKPYPNWSWHRDTTTTTAASCDQMTSVFRMDVDKCNRLWVLDSGIVDAENTVNRTCYPKILIFHLETDLLLWRYVIPEDQSPADSLLSNIVVEIIGDDCLDAYAYLGDVFRYGLVVYSLKTNQSWRLTHSYFYPDPLASDYILDGIRFQWVDGLFGMALSPPDTTANGGNSRKLYFHPLSSYREFAVPTYVLRNVSLGFQMNDYFQVIGEPRGDTESHATGSAMDADAVLFYNLLTKSGIGCWNSNTKVYDRRTQGVIYQNNETLSFPNDMRIDLVDQPEQSIWILSNRLHRFLYSRLNPNEVNFRILTGKTRRIVKGTVCQQGARIAPSIVKQPNIGCVK